MQADLSRKIAEALRLRLTAGERRQLAEREMANPKAYELFLKGRLYWEKGTTEDHKKAIEYYPRAIDVDPGYALAHARLYQAYSTLVDSNVSDPKEFVPKAEEAAHRALEIDESLAEAHVAVGRVNLNAWDWPGAERELRRAIELNPNLAWAHIMFTTYLAIQNRRDEALAAAQRAKELDPLSFDANRAVVYSLLLNGHHDEAREAVKGMLELDKRNPGVHALLGRTYAVRGQYPEAIAALREAISLGDNSPGIQVQIGIMYAKAGQFAQTRAIIKHLEMGKGYVSPADLANLYAVLGEREQAITLFERAYATHDQRLVWLGMSGENPMRSDPRFQDLVRRMRLQP